ncbi:MAG: hypothetical protein HZA54_17945 [Planctomycetes bacterium]|nr:hypothetical protein [Planctomycetota bacterium]
MLRRLLGFALLLTALALTALAGLVLLRSRGAGPALPALPAEVEAGLRAVEQAQVEGLDASTLVAGAALAVLVLAWTFLRARARQRAGGPTPAAPAPPAPPATSGTPETAPARGVRGAVRAVARRAFGPRTPGGGGGCGPWLFAAFALAACAALIAALYYGPETLQLTDTITIRRGPRDRFLARMKWGGIALAALHVLYFLVLSLPRLFGGGGGKGAARRSR